MQKAKVFEIIIEEIPDDSYTKTKGPFIFKMYTSNDSKKVVVSCNSKDEQMMFYTIDYEMQKCLPECNGKNHVGSKFSLNCEMVEYPPKIFYILNDPLTKEFNNWFDSNEVDDKK